MSIAKTNVVAKAAAVVAGLGLVFSAIAPMASAQTTSTADLQAQIAALLSQIQSLQSQLGTSSTSASVTFTTDLKTGSTGASVTALQNWLIAKGYSIPAGATGYFGAQTQAALAAYQAANGITPAAGYFGPITRAKVNASAGTTTGTTTGLPAGCTTTAGFSPTTGASCSTGGTTTTGPLSGGEGSIDNFKIVGAQSTSLNAGDSDTVYGFEFKADGSDLSVNRVDYDVYKSSTSNAGSIRPWNVFQTAELWNGNSKVASVDVSTQSAWSQDGTDKTTGNQVYRVRFDNLSNVVKQGSTVDYYLKLYTQNAISDSNAGATYSVSLAAQGLRATDAMGIQQYTTTGTNYNTVSVDNSTTGTLTVSTGSDNPQTTTVMGDANNTTTGIVLNTFSLQAKDSNVTVYQIPMTVATTSAATVTNMVRSFKLYQGSTLLDTESATANGTVNFQNLNLTISQGNTSNFSVQADINKIDGSNFHEGDGLSVTIPQSGSWDVENASGDNVNVTGGSTGNTITFRSIGFAADSSPSVATAVATNNGGQVTTQTGTFTFTFNVTAFGQDIYVASTSAQAFAATLYGTVNNAPTSTTTTAAAITSTATKASTGDYVVYNGQTKQITISLSKNGGNGAYYYAVLNTLYFATSTSALTSTGTEKSITLPSTYQTNQVIINS